jgi:hypothetical protein
MFDSNLLSKTFVYPQLVSLYALITACTKIVGVTILFAVSIKARLIKKEMSSFKFELDDNSQ